MGCNVYRVILQSLPPLLPMVDAILVLDGDGARLAGKYFGKFLKLEKGTTKQDASARSKSEEDLRKNFEKQLQQKIAGIVARSDAAEVVTVMGRTAVFCGGSNQGASGGGDVRIVHVGPPNESELVLAHLCEGMYDALSHLMGGSTDRTMVLDNLELVFLLIDEHCDGGIILETDANKLASAVLLRDDEGPSEQEHAGAKAAAQRQGMPAGVTAGDMTLGQAFRQARDQFFVGGSGM
jgi:coatomer subunit zeta